MKKADFPSDAAYYRYKQHKYDRYYRATAIYERRGWTDREKDIVMESTVTDRELSARLKRSIKSIQHMRARLRRLDCDR